MSWVLHTAWAAVEEDGKLRPTWPIAGKSIPYEAFAVPAAEKATEKKAAMKALLENRDAVRTDLLRTAFDAERIKPGDPVYFGETQFQQAVCPELEPTQDNDDEPTPEVA